MIAGLATAAVLGGTTAGAAYVDWRVAADERATRDALEERPRCFGAASRDRRVRCRNGRLARMVVPTPIEARALGNDPCTVIAREGRVHVCAFGVDPDRSRATVALVGDSHASHWRAALDRVARAERWRGLSLTRTGCPFSSSVPDGTDRSRANCALWNRQVRAWFAAHPEVRTVFFTAHSGGRIAGARPREQFRAQRAAFARAWRSLPPSVENVVVIRDTPKMRSATLACVQEAIDTGQPAGRACAEPRRRALDPDPAVSAARSLDLPVVDLTRQFCDRRRCYPVIGGALVFRDVDHLTPTFAETLAPLLRRVVDRIRPTWRD